MSFADKINAMPDYMWGRECHPTERVYTYADVQEMVQDFKALAAKHDAVMRMMAEALEALLKRDERNTCQHEDTHRGGFLWTICAQCGRRWSDENGGKPNWKDPVEWDQAVAALQAHKELQ